MRLPQLRLSTLIIAVLSVGLLVGNYARIEAQLGSNLHSYGFPPPTWKIMLLALFVAAIELLVIGLAYGATRVGWLAFTRFTSHPKP